MENMFHRVYQKWKQNEVTLIKEKHLHKFKLFEFREHILTLHGISRHNKNYSIHHLLPMSLIPDRRLDIDNGIPLRPGIHKDLHKEYNNYELIQDHIMPIIRSLNFKLKINLKSHDKISSNLIKEEYIG